MHTENNRTALSAVLQRTFDPKRGRITVDMILNELGHQSLAMILIVFSIPAALPLPAPGYATVLSLPLFFIAFCLLRNREQLWLPESFRRKAFDPAGTQRLLAGMLKLIGFVERFSRPRLVKLVRSRSTRWAVGLMILLCACSMVLPIPLTNTLPAGGIFLIGFSLLEEDGIILGVAMLYSVFALLVTVGVIVLGYEAVKAALSLF